MVVIPSQQPVLENLNAYYLDIRKLLEHFQGEIGSGGIHFKSHTAEGVLFFDQDQLLSGFLQEKNNTLSGHEAIERLLQAGKAYNFIVTVYQIDSEEVYYWAGIQTAEKIYKDLSTEFTDLEGLIKKMGSEKLTGYVDIRIGSGEKRGFIFLINGKIRGGSCSWGNGTPSPSSAHQKLLIQKTKELGGTFNVSRIVLNNLPTDSTPIDDAQADSETAIVMMEALLVIFETVVRENTKKKTDFQKLLKQNLVESAERFAFLDPFAGEFEYAQQSITFSGRASNRDLVQGVCAVVKKMAHDLGLYSALLQKLESWSEEYADELLYYDVNLTEIDI
ncbi:MAG: hypothetical protein PVI38_18205 [Desulfobacterales bacterium]|jgi:hypothetical protein